MRKSTFSLAVTALGMIAAAGSVQATVVASDNADNAAYSPQPNNGWGSINGGFGYGLWTTLGSISGGGTYMSQDRPVDGANSFALFSGGASGSGSGYAISRPLTTSMASGLFSANIRFDLNGDNSNLINVRSGNNTAGFSSGELFSFGIISTSSFSQLSYTDGSGVHLLSSPEDARGAIWSLSLGFNAAAGTYSFSVFDAGGGFSTNFSGNLEASGTTVGSFGLINGSSGNAQNLISDSQTFSTVPEPTTVALFSISGVLLVYKLRRKQK